MLTPSLSHQVRQILNRNSVRRGTTLEELEELLEARETYMRMTPLLMVVATMRKLSPTLGTTAEPEPTSSLQTEDWFFEAIRDV